MEPNPDAPMPNPGDVLVLSCSKNGFSWTKTDRDREELHVKVINVTDEKIDVDLTGTPFQYLFGFSTPGSLYTYTISLNIYNRCVWKLIRKVKTKCSECLNHNKVMLRKGRRSALFDRFAK